MMKSEYMKTLVRKNHSHKPCSHQRPVNKILKNGNYEKNFVKTVIFCCIKRIYLKEESEKQI